MRRDPFVAPAIFLVALWLGGWPRPAWAVSLKAPYGPIFTEEQKQQQRIAGGGLKKRIEEEHRAGRSAFTIPPGDYRWGREGIAFENLAGPFTLRAQGVTFWFDRGDSPENILNAQSGGLRFRNCKNITMSDLTVDLAQPTSMQGTVTRIDYDRNRFEMEVSPGFPAIVGQGGRAIYYKPDGKIMFSAGGDQVRTTEAGSRPGTVWAQMRDPVLLDHNRDPRWKATRGAHGLLAVGDPVCIVLVKVPLFTVEDCAQMVFDGVKVYGAGDVVERGGGGGHLWRNCKLTRRPGTDRLTGCNGMVSEEMNAGSTLDGCEIACTQEVLLNIHGHFSRVAHVDAPDRVVLRRHAGLIPGATLTFWQQDSIRRIGEARITAIEDEKDASVGQEFPDWSRPFARCTLDRPVPGLGAANLVDTHNRQCAGFMVRNCSLHDSPGRAFIVNGGCNGTIERNRWERCAGGGRIAMETGDRNGDEGPFPHDVIVRNNTFADVMWTAGPWWSGDQGLLTIGLTPGGNYLRSTQPIDHIIVEGNTLARPGGAGILMCNTRHGRIRRNQIRDPHYDGFPARIGRGGHPNYGGNYYQPPPDQAIYVAACDHIQIEGNSMVDMPVAAISNPATKSRVVGLGEYNTAITLEGQPFKPGIPGRAK